MDVTAITTVANTTITGTTRRRLPLHARRTTFEPGAAATLRRRETWRSLHLPPERPHLATRLAQLQRSFSRSAYIFLELNPLFPPSSHFPPLPTPRSYVLRCLWPSAASRLCVFPLFGPPHRCLFNSFYSNYVRHSRSPLPRRPRCPSQWPTQRCQCPSKAKGCPRRPRPRVEPHCSSGQLPSQPFSSYSKPAAPAASMPAPLGLPKVLVSLLPLQEQVLPRWLHPKRCRHPHSA